MDNCQEKCRNIIQVWLWFTCRNMHRNVVFQIWTVVLTTGSYVLVYWYYFTFLSKCGAMSSNSAIKSKCWEAEEWKCNVPFINYRYCVCLLWCWKECAGGNWNNWHTLQFAQSHCQNKWGNLYSFFIACLLSGYKRQAQWGYSAAYNICQGTHYKLNKPDSSLCVWLLFHIEKQCVDLDLHLLCRIL